MQNKIYFLMIAAILAMFISCDDIVNSDSNIKKTSLDYSYVLDNQEAGVIMPLKVGNKWLYSVDELNENNVVFRQRLDSIVVLNEQIFESGKWYEVYFPMFSREYNVLMTNTDKGLMIHCEQCLENKFLWATYPKYGKIFYSGLKLFQIKDAQGNPIGEDYIKISKDAENNPIILQNGNEYKTIKYNAFVLDESNKTKIFYYGDEYYVPDLGLVMSYTKPMQGVVGEQYELIRFTDPDKSNNCVYSETINLGKIRVDSVVTLSRSITNTTGIDYNLTSIAVFSNKNIISLGKFNPSMGSWIDNPFKPNQTQSFELIITPDKPCAFSIPVMITHSERNDCFYQILIEGTCVE